jgi:hypothetical protein
MKILLTIAAALAAITSVSAATTNTSATGHYEWQNRAQPEPNKSNLSSRVHVWVKYSSMATNCDDAMMKDKMMSAAGMDMPKHGASYSKG